MTEPPGGDPHHAGSSDGRPVAEEARRALLLRGVPLVLAGALLGGVTGAVVALVAVMATHRRSTGPVTVAALVLLLAAAGATLLEAPVTPSALGSGFAQDRPVASACATAAGILLLVTSVTLLARTTAGRPTAAAAPLAPEPAADPTRAERWRATAVPVVVGVVTALALLLLAPAPPAATREVASSVAMGTGWGRPVQGRIVVDGTEPPLPVVATAVAPGGPRWWTATAGLVAMAVVGALVARRAGRATALVAAGLTGLALVAVRADLAAALAAALMATTLALGDPEGRTTARAAGAGAAFGGVCLCLPAAVFLLPLLAAALALHPRTGEVSAGQGLAGVAAALVVFAPWQRWVLERFTTLSPSDELVVPLSAAAAVALPVVVVAVVALVAGRQGDHEAPDGAEPVDALAG